MKPLWAQLQEEMELVSFAHTHTVKIKRPLQNYWSLWFSLKTNISINSLTFIWKEGEDTKRGSTQKVHIQLFLMVCAHLSFAWSLSWGFQWWLGLGIELDMTRSWSGGPHLDRPTCLCGMDHCPGGNAGQLSDLSDLSVAQVYFWSWHLRTRWEEGRFIYGFVLYLTRLEKSLFQHRANNFFHHPNKNHLKPAFFSV